MPTTESNSVIKEEELDQACKECNPKKHHSSERDSVLKQPKKNSNVKKEVKSVPNKAAGAAILSAMNSPPPQLVQNHHSSSHQFNTNDLVGFLNMRFSSALTAYHDTNSSSRPEKYETPQEKAWTKPVWGQKPKTHGMMANGLDLVSELSK
ncbi:hypothetical protein BY458DRAFT_550968 [Sporodiniella umbellata]|nr:hypothetical protein BY458DRAFT_550968 [Sporodiniella umbellata]